ncbi:MAG: 6-phosphogluconolactonase [Acidiferrobacteraceae bacterium]
MHRRDDERQIFADVEELTHVAAREIVDVATRAIRERRRFLWVLSGGSTPGPVYREIAQHRARGVDWQRLHVFWGDERCVAPDDPRSNFGSAKSLLLDHLPVPLSGIHRIRGEDDPARAAADYEREVESLRAGRPDEPLFDLVLLGLGADGHTASLFPGSPAIHEPDRGVVAVRGPAGDLWRVTLTPRLLSDAREVIFLVAGASKADAVGAMFSAPGGGTPDLPAQRICPPQGQVKWFLDRAAAAMLATGPARRAPPQPRR